VIVCVCMCLFWRNRFAKTCFSTPCIRPHKHFAKVCLSSTNVHVSILCIRTTIVLLFSTGLQGYTYAVGTQYVSYCIYQCYSMHKYRSLNVEITCISIIYFNAQKTFFFCFLVCLLKCNGPNITNFCRG